MAMFMKLGPVQAGDVDSESAAAGEVLTADGAGGAAWAAGGGASGLLWDTFSYTLGPKAGGGEEPYYRSLSFTLKLGGVAIADDTLIQFTFTDALITPLAWATGNTIGMSDSYVVGQSSDGDNYAIGMTPYIAASAPVVRQVYGPEFTFYLVIWKPTGGIEKIEIDLT